MYRDRVTVRRVLLAVFAAIWAVMGAAPAGAAPAGRGHAPFDLTVTSAISGTPNFVAGAGDARRLSRSPDAIDLKAVTSAVDDDDVVDVDADESKRTGQDRYSAVLPRAPDTVLDTIATPHVSHVSSLVLSASVSCPQGRAPPTVLS